MYLSIMKLGLPLNSEYHFPNSSAILSCPSIWIFLHLSFALASLITETILQVLPRSDMAKAKASTISFNLSLYWCLSLVFLKIRLPIQCWSQLEILFIMISRFMLSELPLYEGVVLSHEKQGCQILSLFFAITANYEHKAQGQLAALFLSLSCEVRPTIFHRRF